MYCKLQNVVIFLKKNFTHRKKCPYLEFFSGPFFPALWLNTEVYSVSLRIQSECGKTWTAKAPNADYVLAVLVLTLVKQKQNFTWISIIMVKIVICLLTGKKSYKFKADNINLYFLTLVVLRIISEKYDSDYATQTSDYWY